MKEGYIDTDIGKIPEKWEVKELKDITVLLTNGFVGIAKRHYSEADDSVLYIQGFNVEENSFNLTGIKKVSRDFHNKHPRSNLRHRDLLTVQTGDVGLTTYVPKELEGANCHALIISRYKENITDSKFVSYYLNSQQGRLRLKEIETGTTMKHINVGSFQFFNIPFPPLTEQQAIAEALSNVDALIDALNKQIEKKKNIKQGAMQELLTGKKRLQGFSGQWEEIILGEIGSWGKGNQLSKKDILPDGNHFCIHYGELFTTYKEVILTCSSTCNLKNNTVLSKKGDLLFPASDVTPTGLGRCSVIMKDHVVLGGDIIYLRPKEKYNPIFLSYSINCNKKSIIELVTGTTVKHINSSQLKTISIGVPLDIEEQTAIAQILTDMDNEIEQLEKKRDKYLNIKSGMMQQLLTGQIRLINTTSCSEAQEAKIKNYSPDNKKKHSKQFDEAVIISFLVDKFGSIAEPLSRFMYTKLSYLIHRKHDCIVIDYKKFAAGPYNPKSRYGGPEKIGKENGYFDLVKDAKGYDAFVPQKNIQEAVDYFTQWYGTDIQNWIEQFRQYKPWNLETLATVDMAINDLEEKGVKATVITVKTYLSSIPKWKAKLDKPHFSDVHIQRAINESIRLFKI